MKTQIFLSGKRTTALLIGLALLSAVSGCGKTSQINDSAAVPANAPVSDSGTDAPADSSADSEADSNTDANGIAYIFFIGRSFTLSDYNSVSEFFYRTPIFEEIVRNGIDMVSNMVFSIDRIVKSIEIRTLR